MENNTNFSQKQTDGFNEVMEIGLNSSAEILSKLLNNEVSMETQQLNQEVIRGLESFGDQAGLAVGINVSGAVEGKAAVVVQSTYVKEILNILMSVDSPETSDDDELDEISIGTFKELVGQMVTAFAESFTNFLGTDVVIEAGASEEISEECDEVADIIEYDIDDEAYSLVTSFNISNNLSGTFVTVLSEQLIENTLSRIMTDDDENDDDYGEFNENNSMAMQSNMGAAIAAARKAGQPTSVMKKGVNVQSASFPSFAGAQNGGGTPLLNGNIDLLMDVPLNVTIEIGKTRKKMRDIMEFAQGTIIDLEKQAGAPVDVVVNGQLIARGDVVVIDDNFGVRITEIVGNTSLLENK